MNIIKGYFLIISDILKELKIKVEKFLGSSFDSRFYIIVLGTLILGYYSFLGSVFLFLLLSYYFYLIEKKQKNSNSFEPLWFTPVLSFLSISGIILISLAINTKTDVEVGKIAIEHKSDIKYSCSNYIETNFNGKITQIETEDCGLGTHKVYLRTNELGSIKIEYFTLNCNKEKD